MTKSKTVAKFEQVDFPQFMADWITTYGDMPDAEQEGIHFTAEEIIHAIYDDIKIPVRSTSGAAGYDFYSPIDYEIEPGQSVKIPTSIRCKINDGWCLIILPRSSYGIKYKMKIDNTVPLIDSDYYNSLNQGHIFIQISNEGNKPIKIARGDRFVQGVFLPYGIASDDNVSTERTGGIGSTGK